jgi:peptidoglycan biosynthesis protein MviN/MurJ (putative lipid II flippase)
MPSFVLRRLRRSPSDGLTLLRVTFLAFCIAIALIGWVVAILNGIGDEFGRVAVAPVLLSVVVVGVAAQMALSLVRRPLDCTDSAALARSYVSRRFFTRLAFSEVPALVGFVAFLLTTEPWLYPLGAAFTAVGFARTAPTRAQLNAEQEQLVAAGCDHSLTEALMGNKPGKK